MTGLFPSIRVEQGHQYMVTGVSRVSPALAGTLALSVPDSSGVKLDLLISVAITVMLCHSSVSRSRSFDVKMDPFPESMLNILSISVCRSTEYLKMQSRIFKRSSLYSLVSHFKTTPKNICFMILFPICSTYLNICTYH